MHVARIHSETLPEGSVFFYSLHGEEKIGRPFSYEVEIFSEDPDVDLASVVGSTLAVGLELNADDGESRFIHGYVTSCRYLGVSGKYWRYVVTLKPWTALLTYRKNSRIFQSKTVPEILKTLFGEYGFADRASFSGLSRSTYQTWEYLVQHEETDFDFMQRLLEQEGIYYFFEHEVGKHTMRLGDSSGAHTTFTGYETVPYFPKGNTTQRKRDHIEELDFEQEITPGASAFRSFDFTRPRLDLTVKGEVGEAKFSLASPSVMAHAKLETYDHTSQYVEPSVGQQYARDQVERGLAELVVLKASGNAGGLLSGFAFTLADYPLDKLNREYLILDAKLDITLGMRESGDGEVGYTGETLLQTTIRAIPSSTTYRLPKTTALPRVSGPQTAIVVGPDGKEIWTDEYGRVKVQFHWDREGKKDEKSSCWVRVSHVWAGAKWGVIHIPRIGQEVIVEFLDGDPNRPIITGRVYNADNMPPYELSQNQTQSGIKTRSTDKGGVDNFNELRFEDAKGKEHVYLQAEKDFQILVKHDETKKIENDRTEEIVKNETIKVGENRTEEVGKDEVVTIKGKRTHEVQGDEALTTKGNRALTLDKDLTEIIKGKSTTTIDGDVTFTAKANRTAKVTGNESSEVEGDRTAKVAGTSSLEITGDASEKVGGAHSIEVTGNQTKAVDGDASDHVKGAFTLKVDGDGTFTIAGAHEQKVTGASKTKAQKITIEADQEITLKSGSASITIKSSGDIEIKGANVKINGQAAVDVKGASVSVSGSSVKVG